MPYVKFQRISLSTERSNGYSPRKEEFAFEYENYVEICATRSRFVILRIDDKIFSRVIPTSIRIVRKEDFRKENK